MACQGINEDAQAYLDGELSPARRATVEEHLRRCKECREVLRELEAVSAALGGWADRQASTRFEFGLNLKMSDEPVPAAVPAPAKARRTPQFAVKPAPRGRLVSLLRDWRAIAVAASVMVAFIALVSVSRTDSAAKPGRRTTGGILTALAAASSSGQMADASVFADLSARRAIAAVDLNSPRVAKSDIIGSFLTLVDSQADKNAGGKLVNLLAEKPGWNAPIPARTAGPRISAISLLFGTPAYAGELVGDPLLIARRFEFQGRLREAAIKYVGITDPSIADRAKLAEGAVKLRLGDLEGARASLETAASGSAAVRAMADELLAEVDDAREARAALAEARSSAMTGADWHKVGLLEVKAYDFRNAANSFMKAANAASAQDAAAAVDARFRSAWCHMASGQISTGTYGFRSIAGADGEYSELQYAARLEEAIGLSRMGKAAESVAVCAELAKGQAPSRTLEALCFFHKGVVELRDLKDGKAAAESLGRVSAAGQGNLSYAAQLLAQTSGQ